MIPNQELNLFLTIMKNLLWPFLLLLPSVLMAQFNLSGTVKKSNSKENLIGATVQIKSTYQAVATNQNGSFEFKNLREGNYILSVSFIGFEDTSISIQLNESKQISIFLNEKSYLQDEILVQATRVSEISAATYTNISKEEIEKNNLGQDIPYLLENTPSLVSTSDAGAGIGYTSMRIRGSDASRINVTVNGIPINDAESHGVFWVNMPDLASSLESIQIQRGVGTSTNGAAAFGASINMQTTTLNPKAHAEISNSYGSYNTFKHNIQFGSGLIDDKFSFEGRISKIRSDGYIDRASSNLSSYYLSGGYYGKKTIVKAITFGGKEKTYQSWYGTPEARINNDYQGMIDHANNEGYSPKQLDNLLNSGRTYNFYLYENQTDNYNQDHYQLLLSHEFSTKLNGNLAFHYTRGLGYYEEYKDDEDFVEYGLVNPIIGNDTIASTDLIRRRWLDNHFGGLTYSINYKASKQWKFTFGGGFNKYEGDHYGEIIWAEIATNSFINERYYENTGFKDDFNSYLKVESKISDKLTAFLDGQLRLINYSTYGIDNDQRPIDVSKNFAFFNPKAGLHFEVNSNLSAYGSYSISNREPVRNDFIDAPLGKKPKHEQLKNIELGAKYQQSNYFFQLNLYDMTYKNQLVLTGELNDVGSAIRQNVDKSYRRGIEINGGVTLLKTLKWQANATFSENKIDTYTDFIYDYILESNISYEFKNTDISFSPNLIVGSELIYEPLKDLNIALISKYVGDQYLDNTTNENKKIDAYLVHHARLNYSIKNVVFKEINFSLLVNNLFDLKYSSNGYTYSYAVGNVITENFYYPQAGRNFLAGLTFKF